MSSAQAADPAPLAGDAISQLPDRPSISGGRPVGGWAFLGVTITSLGGPLALAALYAPTIVADASFSAGLVMVAAAVVFVVPLAIWLHYSRHIASAGGLYSFVDAAAGRRVALMQAGLWIFSYVLYLLYTTASIVYDTLPRVVPGVRPYQPALEIAIPVALAAVMLAGRAATLAVTGILAAGQMILVGILAGVTIGHDSPVSSFGGHAPAGAFATATAQTALLYICGSLPLFLGGEVRRPTRTVRRGLVAGYVLVAAGVIATVFPYAENPAFTRAAIPGMSVAQVLSGHALAVTVGIGVAASVAGVMLVEYLALTRILHAVTGRSVRRIAAVIAVPLIAAGPISLINPDRFYSSLIKPSLVALWLSQLMVFAVYPRFSARYGGRVAVSFVLAVAGCVFAGYGIWATLHHGSS